MVYWPSNLYSSRRRSKMRLAVWRCFLGRPKIVLQDPVDDTGEGFQLGAFWAETAAGIPAGLKTPASCAPCPGAARTPWRPPVCSSHPPSPPCGPADIRPPCPSITPSISTTSNLWMAADGTFFNRHKSGSQSVQVVHFSSAVYRLARQFRNVVPQNAEVKHIL